MPNIGPLELAIVLIIALVVFGPKRLPELGRSLGKGIREFRGSVSGDSHDEPEERESIEAPKSPAKPGPEGEKIAHDRH
ncbi:MAG TPA: twin-arginine translocase TatA/TatE family subunit [Solirubrobacterales bacterium]|nr:twin-arginine translocase TatA/TatE family subunit [Solirubrobacterales bacterium]